MKQRIVDLSHPLSPETPVFPDYPPVAINVLDSAERRTPGVRNLNSGHVGIGLHCGTHLDAPFHFFGDGPTVDAIPPERCVGPATVIHLEGFAAGDVITTSVLEPYRASLHRTGRALIDTGWHRRWGLPGYFSDHPVLDGAAAEFLIACGVGLVGVDFPSVDRPPFPAHLALLGGGVLIVENLTGMEALTAPAVEFLALPLKIVGRDGSPVRAVARWEENV